MYLFKTINIITTTIITVGLQHDLLAQHLSHRRLQVPPVRQRGGCHAKTLNRRGCYAKTLNRRGCHAKTLSIRGCHAKKLSTRGFHVKKLNIRGCHVNNLDKERVRNKDKGIPKIWYFPQHLSHRRLQVPPGRPPGRNVVGLRLRISPWNVLSESFLQRRSVPGSRLR